MKVHTHTQTHLLIEYDSFFCSFLTSSIFENRDPSYQSNSTRQEENQLNRDDLQQTSHHSVLPHSTSCTNAPLVLCNRGALQRVAT